jgi:ribosomal-protein-alanine N-acetyltransferase
MSLVSCRGAATAVLLRPLMAADADAVHAFLSDWSVVRYMALPYCATQEESRKCLSGLMADDPCVPWQSVVRAIARVDTGAVVGLCGIAIPRGSEEGELWYLVQRDHWGRGIAPAAARELLRIGFQGMRLHRMFATCLPENPASARVLEKIGMRKEGYQVEKLRIHGTWRDCCLYALVREAWDRQGAARGGETERLGASG